MPQWSGVAIKVTHFGHNVLDGSTTEEYYCIFIDGSIGTGLLIGLRFDVTSNKSVWGTLVCLEVRITTNHRCTAAVAHVIPIYV